MELEVGDYVIFDSDIESVGYTVFQVEQIFSQDPATVKEQKEDFYYKIQHCAKKNRIVRVQKNGWIVLQGKRKIKKHEIALAYRYNPHGAKFKNWYQAYYDKSLKPKKDINKTHINLYTKPETKKAAEYIKTKAVKDDFYHYYKVSERKDAYDWNKPPNSYFREDEPYSYRGENYYFTKDSKIENGFDTVKWMRTRENLVPTESIWMNFPFKCFLWNALDNGTIKVSA